MAENCRLKLTGGSGINALSRIETLEYEGLNLAELELCGGLFEFVPYFFTIIIKLFFLEEMSLK